MSEAREKENTGHIEGRKRHVWLQRNFTKGSGGGKKQNFFDSHGHPKYLRVSPLCSWTNANCWRCNLKPVNP